MDRMQATCNVYHFTDSARLPWIIASGELRPGRNRIGDFPADFLWATVNQRGDRTATAMHSTYQNNKTALIRLTLHSDDFEVWPDILERFPEYTSKHVWQLEESARRWGEDPRQWRARVTPLPLSRVIVAEAKTFVSRWKVIDLQQVCVQSSHHPRWRGMVLNDFVFASQQHIGPDQAMSYDFAKMSIGEWTAGINQRTG